MQDLFDDTAALSASAPLAERLRPRRLSDVVGQRHLLAQGAPLQLAFASGKPHSMILWGPPGVGKTTLARLAAEVFEGDFVALSAVFAGVKDIRAAVEQAQQVAARGRRSILFVDEIHRFNKAQQDALLPFVESGLVTLIGATTENPSFEVNSALLSRAQVYVLKPLSQEDLLPLAQRAMQTLALRLDEAALALLLAQADGDARRLLNLMEQVHTAAQAAGQDADALSEAFVRQTLAQATRRFDKGGDQFYEQISALHKSVRGSAPDAALYWLCRMLDGGADPHYLCRRIVRMAWEDVGLADPRALHIASDAAATYERLGSPEGELALAQAVLYLAVAPKSNAGYVAYKAARAFVRDSASLPVPLHLRNAPTRLMRDLDYGAHYRYAHDEAQGYAAGERYFPDALHDAPRWYAPVARGLEAQIAEKLARLRALDEQAQQEGGAAAARQQR